VDADAPVDEAELTAHFGLNHNIRQHVAKLVGARLAVESKAFPTGRGRPRLRYTVGPTSESRWGSPGPYERLSMLHTESVRSGDTLLEVGRRGPAPARGGSRSTVLDPNACEKRGDRCSQLSPGPAELGVQDP
jgi:hypothetical protein